MLWHGPVRCRQLTLSTINLSLLIGKAIMSYMRIYFGVVSVLFVELLMGACTAKAAWTGPTEGPAAQANKKIAFIMSDVRNGGVTGVKAGFMEATRMLSWKVEVRDGDGDLKALNRHLAEALNAKFDGIVLCGFQPDQKQIGILSKKKKQSIVVGWHAGPKPGATSGLFTNVSTDPAEVGKLTIQALRNTGSKSPGVVLISDNSFSIAREKIALLSKILKTCRECRLLFVENIPIARAQEEIPGFVQRMNTQFGKAWTHTIAINDIYFDNMNFPLREAGRLDIKNIAAGDGSQVAISRIKGGSSQQSVTIAEPLMAQGWQIADELNRGFAGQTPSGYDSKPIVVTKEYLDSLPAEDIEGSLDFRAAYTKIWLKK